MNIRCFEYMYAIIEHLLFAKSVHNRKKIHSTWEVEREKKVFRDHHYTIHYDLNECKYTKLTIKYI